MADSRPSHPSAGPDALTPHDSPVQVCKARVPVNIIAVVRSLCSSEMKDGTPKTKEQRRRDNEILKTLRRAKVTLCRPYNVNVLTYRDGEWRKDSHPAGGFTNEQTNEVTIVDGDTSENTTTALVHESMHVGQDPNRPQDERDFEARAQTEQWAIDHQLPPTEENFRTSDGKVNEPAIRKFVTLYPTSPITRDGIMRIHGGPHDAVMENGKRVPAREGMVVQEPEPTGIICEVDPKAFDCRNLPRK